jgi:hypothetical protein
MAQRYLNPLNSQEKPQCHKKIAFWEDQTRIEA